MKNLGLWFAAIYLAVSAYFIFTQGLFGESFVALLLGFPWTFALAFFEFFNAEGIFAALLLLAPIALNAYILYVAGRWLSGPKPPTAPPVQ